MKRWYVVHTKPNGEARAKLNLFQQGFDAYLPRYMGHRRHARRIARVAKPLFPRYLFVQLDLEHDRWRAVNGTFGVSHLVTINNTPSAVPEGLIEAIRQRENDEGRVRLDIAPFKPGETLEILEGPMATNRGLFLQMQDTERVVLLLGLLGRQIRVTMPLMAVSAA